MLASRRPALAEQTVVVRAAAEELRTLHASLDHFWDAVDRLAANPPDQDWRLGFTTAVAEVATNIMRHAYPHETASGSLRLRLRLYPDRVVAGLADQGVAFTRPAPAKGSPKSDPRDLAEGGYGLALARASLDQLAYRRTPGGANSWRLVKRL